jgi:Fic family protein
MTKLSERKSRLAFTTDAQIRYRGKLRAVIVEVDNPFTASVRLSGTRQRYPFSWHWLHDEAAALFSRQERERKKKERADKKRNT